MRDTYLYPVFIYLAEMSVLQYQEDSDFDEAFKNLLQPIESITKIDSCEILQYDLVKELNSYSNHLKKSPNGSSSVFVEAAIILQNTSLIYQKRIDAIINAMMNLIGKFRSYKLNENIDPDYTEKRVGNKKKNNGKKFKCYSFFGPIENHIFGTLKNFDCKQINLKKKPLVTQIVLNTNIKVDNKYSKLLPYICNANKENIGKKYDFKINFPLDCDLAVNEEFYCPTEEDSKSKNPISYRKNTNSLPMNLLDVDEILPSDPNSVIIYQNVFNEVFVTYKTLQNPIHMLNVSQITHDDNYDDDPRAQVLNAKCNNCTDKPYVKKKDPKKKDKKMLSPMHMNTDLPLLVDDEEMEEILRIGESNENVQTYQRNTIDLQNYENNKMETMNEQLKMQNRVLQWHNNLRPILEKEEKLIEFDIHEYGTRILSCFKSIGEQKLFKDLVGGIDKVEVARYYLSLLMMINTNNFEVSNHISGNDLLVKLLKKERHHEELQVNIGNQVTQNSQ
ncbi:uncharacterized protein LOC132944456 isoform X2 [Metopolophium dirhodum]|uniref:uncharacterized protein LOC132944456 isoform X2 n=1 Tax=Metopolophium dirhodum TaxID=44670 RepID=UPI00298FB7FA|nr:uncharacterized protein LOC132944456 isoform X2 [Metopolophium dirhodum]